MKQPIRRIMCLILAFALLAPVFPQGAQGAQPAQNPVVSRNERGQNYTRWASPVKSTLAAEGNGYLRAEYVENQLVVERYDSSFQIVSQQMLSLPLPIYGGVYICDDANFVVCGQENPEESNEKEVIRVIRYSKNWQEEGYASVFGANTTVPFDAGTVRFARAGNYLFIRTCHEMYASSDGLNHQANMTLRLDVSTMTNTDIHCMVSNSSTGYCSHSFNQFILVDGDTLVALDHGDAYPRSVALFRYRKSATAQPLEFRTSCLPLLPIVGAIGNNSTGVSVGGFEASSSHYLAAGNTVVQVDGTDFNGQRNIFVAAVPKNDLTEGAVQVHQITDYAPDSGIRCTTPHLLRLSSDRFFLTWSVGDQIYYCFLDGTGAKTSEIYTQTAALSDCAPILVDNTIVWYVTSDTYPVFYQIPLDHPDTIQFSHQHFWESTVSEAPTEAKGGLATACCAICQQEMPVSLPVLSEADYTFQTLYEPACWYAGSEKITWKETAWGTISFTRTLPALGCDYGDWVVTQEPSCTTRGERTQACRRCGNVHRESLDVLPHTWDEGRESGQYLVKTCTVCGAEKKEALEPRVIRVYGSNRYETSLKTADELKTRLGLTQFQNIIVSSGSEFADALAGSYLAAEKEAPILLVHSTNIDRIKDYIRKNLVPGGTVYILGGVNAVPAAMETGLTDYTVKRLGGANRYETNLAILQEAGSNFSTLLVCTGRDFADSLSVSATGLPILLVHDKLTPAQKAFLQSRYLQIYIIGGTNAVRDTVAQELQQYGQTLRIAGDNRYETSLAVAEQFFYAPSQAVLAYGRDFPDGLCGGVLAHALHAPLILTANGVEDWAKWYAYYNGITAGYVLGGPILIPDNAAKTIFGRDPDYELVVR